MAHGLLESAQQLLQISRGGNVLNTAFIERLNATFRERLATLTRRTRHAAQRVRALETGMYLIGCVYNWCVVHDELSSSRHLGVPTTPAIAAGLTDRIWRVRDLLTFKVAPAPCHEPKRRGRPPQKQAVDRRPPPHRRLARLRPFLRFRKGVLHVTG